jgi:thioredoxin-like negative regulator of GroEL
MIEQLLEAERALSYGLVDRAEQLYRTVAEHDPRNSIAVVGLARVAIERGDDRTAYVEARRALALDPDNPAARNMVVRLEEVMQARGEELPEVGDAVTDPAGPAPADEPASASAPRATSPAASAAPRKRGLVARLLGRR